MLSKGRMGTISQAEILTEWQFTCGPQTRYFGNNDAAVPWRGVKSFSKRRTQTKSQLKGAPLVLHCGGPLVVNLLLPNPFCSLISASWKWRRFKHLKCLVKSLIREQHLSVFLLLLLFKTVSQQNGTQGRFWSSPFPLSKQRETSVPIFHPSIVCSLQCGEHLSLTNVNMQEFHRAFRFTLF